VGQICSSVAELIIVIISISHMSFFCRCLPPFTGRCPFWCLQWSGNLGATLLDFKLTPATQGKQIDRSCFQYCSILRKKLH